VRSLSPQALALINGGACKMVSLAEMQTDVPAYLNSSPITIEWNSQTWLGAGVLGTIEPIKDTAVELTGARFQLSGIPVERLSDALQEETRGKLVYVYIMILDNDTEAVVWVEQLWSGSISKMQIVQTPPQDGNQGSIVIGVDAAHAGAQMLRSRPLRFTEEDTQKISPGDTSGRFALQQAQENLVWPSAAYFKK
jgi:hypothetical protein